MKKILSAITVFTLILSLLCSCGTETIKTPDNTADLFGDVLFGDVFLLRSTKSFDGIYCTSLYDDTLLVTHERNDQVYAMFYDLKKGEIISDVCADLTEYYKSTEESDFDAADSYNIRLIDGKTAYIIVGSKAHLFNNKMEFIRTIDAGNDINNIFALGGHIWASGNCTLTEFDSNGEPHRYTVDDAYSFSPCAMNGNRAVFTCYDKYGNSMYLSLDTESGKYEQSFPSLGSFSCYIGGAIYDYDSNTSTLRRTDPNLNSAASIYDLDDRLTMVIAADDKYFYVDLQSVDYSGFAKYSVNSGQLCDKLVVDNDSKYIIDTFSAQLYSGNFILIVTDDTCSRICLWKSGETGVKSGFKNYGDSKKYEVSYLSADEMCGKYNIGVYYGEKASEHDFVDYSVEPLNDNIQLKNAINDVLSVLDKTPDGFVDELIRGFNGFDLYLCSTMKPRSMHSISLAAGFTCIEDNRIVVAIDATQSGIAQTFAHEFMHCIEISINNSFINMAFSNWSDYNPDGFDYNYTYENSNGIATGSGYDTKYTAETDAAYRYENNGGKCPDIYFVDGYSKTFPNEDRARIFEHLCCDGDKLNWYFDSDKLNAKAKYLCKSLRECFDTLKNCDNIYWERGL